MTAFLWGLWYRIYFVFYDIHYMKVGLNVSRKTVRQSASFTATVESHWTQLFCEQYNAVTLTVYFSEYEANDLLFVTPSYKKDSFGSTHV